MSDNMPKTVWSCDALRSSGHWDELREKARNALTLFGWRADVPRWSCSVGLGVLPRRPRPDANRDGLENESIMAILRVGYVKLGAKGQR